MPTGTVKNGDAIGVYVNNMLIANGKECSFDPTVAQRETTTKEDVGTASYEPTKKSFTLKGSFLHAEDANCFNQLFALLNSRQKFTWKHGSVASGETFRFGTGFFTGLSLGAPDNDNVTGNYTIQVTGPVQTAVNP